MPVTSTLISGDHKAILVDAQFDVSRAAEVVRMVDASGKRVTTIFVSYSDPDFYFGLATLRDAFSDARILATSQTAWLMSGRRMRSWRSGRIS